MSTAEEIIQTQNRLKAARHSPYLSRQDEMELVKKWKERQDPSSITELFENHQRLIAKIARGYRGYGLPLTDLISEGNIGMMQALKNFDPDRGFRLSTYAVWWIKSAINEYIMSMISLVRIASSPQQRKLFFKLKRTHERLDEHVSEYLTDEMAQKIAETLDVKKEEVIRMHGRMSRDVSLNTPVSSDHTVLEWQDWIQDPAQTYDLTYLQNAEVTTRKALLNNALNDLMPREKDIFIRRRLKDPADSLDKISKDYNISRERVRQIELVSYSKIRKSIEKNATKHFDNI